MLQQRDSLPAGFLHASARELHHLLPGPTLIHLPGHVGGPLFVTILQHGNEDSGLRAVQRLLAEFQGHPLPRPLSLFAANVDAAREGRRRLEGQPDYNRCWPGTDREELPETVMMAAVFETMRERRPFAAVDVHNTTGHNPLHAAVNVLDDRNLQLARRFSRTVVHFTRPHGALAAAFADICPAVILECGRAGEAAGIDRAHAFLRECLLMETLSDEPPPPDTIDLFTSIALVRIPDDVHFRFGNPDGVELALDPALDRWNFRELPAGTVIGRVRGEALPLHALAPDGRDVTADLFELHDGALRLRRTMTPVLLTRDPNVIRQDCLCHLLERSKG